jgi:hypothetical protein
MDVDLDGKGNPVRQIIDLKGLSPPLPAPTCCPRGANPCESTRHAPARRVRNSSTGLAANCRAHQYQAPRYVPQCVTKDESLTRAVFLNTTLKFAKPVPPTWGRPDYLYKAGVEAADARWRENCRLRDHLPRGQQVPEHFKTSLADWLCTGQ